MLPDRVVFDVNVIVSYAVNRKLLELITLVSKYNIEIFSCEELLEELRSVLDYPHLEKYLSKNERSNIVRLFESVSTSVNIDTRYDGLIDPKDNYLVDLVYAIKANYLVSGDREVLIQKHIGRIQIISPAQFKKLLRDSETV